MKHWKRAGAAVVAVGLLLAACGDDGEPEVSSATTEADEQFPTSIVSISPTATEMLFAIDAGDQVEAVDDNSNFPEGVPTTDLSSFEPNVEAIAGYEPDLVVAATDPGDLVDGLTALDIPVLLLPAAEELDDVYEQIEQLGDVTGHADEAADLVGQMRTEIEELAASVPPTEGAPSFYHELDNTFFSTTSATFIGKIYALAGLENIADAADDGTGYPQLSAEYIIESDPDLVFLADTKCCGQNLETVRARPGWDQLTAVRQGNVVELDDDVVSRWGPRIVDFLRVVVESVQGL